MTSKFPDFYVILSKKGLVLCHVSNHTLFSQWEHGASILTSFALVQRQTQPCMRCENTARINVPQKHIPNVHGSCSFSLISHLFRVHRLSISSHSSSTLYPQYTEGIKGTGLDSLDFYLFIYVKSDQKMSQHKEDGRHWFNMGGRTRRWRILMC